MPKVDAEIFFNIDEKNNQVDLTDQGIQLITKSGEDPEFFIIPDIATKLADIEKSDLSTDEKLHRKENLLNEYSLKADRIHTVQQLLKAYTLFDKDVLRKDWRTFLPPPFPSWYISPFLFLYFFC